MCFIYLFIFLPVILRKKKSSLRFSIPYFKSQGNSVFWQCVRGGSCTLGGLRNVPLSFPSDGKLYESCSLNECSVFTWPFSPSYAFEMCVGLSTAACLGCMLTDGFWPVSVTWPMTYLKRKIGFYSIFRWFLVPQTLPQQQTENTGGIHILWKQWDRRVPCGTEGWRQPPRAGEIVMDGQASQGVCTILAEALFNSFEPLWWFPLA